MQDCKSLRDVVMICAIMVTGHKLSVGVLTMVAQITTVARRNLHSPKPKFNMPLNPTNGLTQTIAMSGLNGKLFFYTAFVVLRRRMQRSLCTRNMFPLTE